jgi:hypothetical protein
MNYQIDDVVAGRCTLEQVGTPKPEVILEPSAKDQILEDLVANSITPKTQAGFNKWAEQNPSLYYPMLAKHNLARLAKEQSPSLPKLEELSLADLNAYSSADIKRMLLNSVGITTKDQAQAALDRGRAAEC